MLALVRRALRVTPLEWLDFLRAQLALVAAVVAVRIRSRGQLLTYTAADTPADLPPALLARARALSTAVDRAARFGLLRPRCLVRSVALHRLLQADGIPGSRIRIGVRTASQQLDAHAWVTLADQVVGDDPRFTGRFTEIADAQLAGLA